MKDIEIKISKETRKILEISKLVIGNDGENLQGNLKFFFSDEFVEGQARLEYVLEDIEDNKNKKYQTLMREGESYIIPIKSVLTKQGKLFMQLVITEGIEESEIPVFKSNVFFVKINESINAEIEQPDEYQTWIEFANTKLNQVDNLDISATKIDGIAIITITKKDGTQEVVEILDGDAGTNAGTTNYQELENKPKINDIELDGNKSLEDLGIQPKGDYLKEELDPSVPQYVKNIKEEDINKWNNKSNFSGNYEDLNNLPELPDVSNFMTEQDVKDLLENKDCLKEKDIYVVNLPSENVTSIITDLSIAFGEANAKYQNDKKNKRYAYILNLNKDHVDILVLDCSILSGTATSITMVGQLLKNNDSSIIYKEYKFNYMKYSNTSFSVMSMTLTTSQNNYATEEYVDELVGDINTILSTLTTVSEVVE